MKMIKVGQTVITKVEKVCLGTNGKAVIIPIGTKGLICEVFSDHVEVEIWGDDAPKFVFGVYSYAFDEVELFTLNDEL